MELAGKICLVTGASSGIGRRTALDLARDGATVCVVARRESRLKELVDEMGGPDAGHSYFAADVGERHQVQALVQHVRDAYGRLDVLVNNAGINLERGFRGAASIDDTERVMRVNFLGAVYCTGELLPLLVSSAPSSVVNVASMAGRLATGGAAAYNASKFALTGWSESLHWELEDVGVCVSSVEPGFVSTEGFPQDDLMRDPVFRHIVATDQHVSDAIRDAIRGRKMQRVVPRYYYPAQFLRLAAPPLWAVAMRKLVKPRAKKRAEAFTKRNEED